MTDERTVFGTIAMRFSQSEEGVERSSRPFRIGLFGDFSGPGEVPRPISGCRPLLIDRDNYEEVMARICPRVRIELGGGAVEVEFREMDDFTPDRLFRDVALFEEFRSLRRRLTNPATFAEAAAELRSPLPGGAEPPQACPAAGDTVASGDRLLDLVLEETDAQRAPPEDGASLADRLVKEIVAPYVIPSPDPEQGALVAAVDKAASETMAAVLHAPQFQALESAWRSVELLVRRLETGSSLKLHLLDISRQALQDDLNGNDDLAKSGLYRLLVEEPLETPGGEPWSLLIADYPFTPAPEDARLAGRLAKLCAAAGAPFVAGADAGFVGVASLGDSPDPDDWSLPDGEGASLWADVRRLPEAAFLALVAPRFLLRLPYGASTRAAESFAFEEAPGRLAHEHYLWGGGAVLVALAMAGAFSRHGWDIKPGALSMAVERLPLHVFKEDGEAQVTPCAEILLTDRGAGLFAASGITPLRSVRDADRVLVGSLRSLCESPTPLRGRWD